MLEYLSALHLPNLLKSWVNLRKTWRNELDALGLEIGVNWKTLLEVYIPPRCQPTCTFSEDEHYDKPIFTVLNSFFGKTIAGPPQGKDVFFVLAGAGMGKSSLLGMIHYFSLSRFWPTSEETLVVKLGSDSIKRIEAIENPSNCILLLDSLDEDSEAYDDIGRRLLEIIRAVSGRFKRTVVTCRTQFFPQTIERNGSVKIGSFRCEATYLSPFNSTETESYLRKRYGGAWHRLSYLPLLGWVEAVRRKSGEEITAEKLVGMMGELSSRPLLLANLEDISRQSQKVKDAQILESQSEYALFRWLIDGWLDREHEIIVRQKENSPTVSAVRPMTFF